MRTKKHPNTVPFHQRYGVGNVINSIDTTAEVQRSRKMHRGLAILAVASVISIGFLQAKGEINVVPWQDEQGQPDWGQIDVVPFDDNRNVPEPGMPPSNESPTDRLEVNLGG